MPTLPWTDCRYRPRDGESLHVLTSTLPLKSYRDVPRFLRWTLRIRKQHANADGVASDSLAPVRQPVAHVSNRTTSALSPEH